MSRETCQITVVHQERLEQARSGMPAEAEVVNQAELFKLLGDATRLRLLQALSVTEMCVCDLAALLDSTPSAVSHQLRLLRTASLVKNRREGKVVYYRLGNSGLTDLLSEGQRYLGQGER